MQPAAPTHPILKYNYLFFKESNTLFEKESKHILKKQMNLVF